MEREVLGFLLRFIGLSGARKDIGGIATDKVRRIMVTHLYEYKKIKESSYYGLCGWRYAYYKVLSGTLKTGTCYSSWEPCTGVTLIPISESEYEEKSDDISTLYAQE